MRMTGNEAEKQADGQQIDIDTAILLIQTEAITLTAEMLKKTEDGGYAIEKALSILEFAMKIACVLKNQRMLPNFVAGYQKEE